MQFPIGIFGVSLAAATLPAVSRFLAVQKNTEAGSELNASLRMTLSVNIPAAAGLMGLGIPLIALLFQHGRVFGVSDTAQTASALFWYALGLPGYSVVKVLVPVFYALKNTKIPVLVSFVMVVLGALLNYILLKVYQYPFWCLALATSFTASLNAIILLIWLQIRLPGVLSFELLRSFFANLVIGAAIYFGCIECVSWVEGYQQLGHGVHFLKSFFWAFEIFSSMILALFLWWGLGVILRVKENQKAFQFFLNFFRKKLRRSS
jgi:putative peptidoglycan lipid II flippase